MEKLTPLVSRLTSDRSTVLKILLGLVCVIIVSIYIHYRPYRWAKIDLYQMMWEAYPPYSLGKIKLYNLKHGKNWFDVCGEFRLTYMARSKRLDDPIFWITTPPIKFIHDKYYDGYSISIHAPNYQVYSVVEEEAAMKFVYYDKEYFNKLEKEYCK